MMKIYSTDCPKCKILLKKLEQKNKIPGRDFELIEDNKEIMKVASEHGIVAAPFLINDGQVYLFSDAVKLVNEIGA